MVTIGRMPRKCKRFFRPVRRRFEHHGFDHFWMLVLAMSIGHGSTLDRLAKLLRGQQATHRTNHGEFLWRSLWEQSDILRDMLVAAVKQGRDRQERFVILDDTQTLKRAKKMEAVGKLFHHATGKYARGHTILKACLWVNGVTIPWGLWVYVKKEQASELGRPFRKLTELAEEAIWAAELPAGVKMTVLFDAFYLCPTVTDACIERGWHYIGVGEGNRRFTPLGTTQSRRLNKYGRNLLSRKGQWHSVRGLKSQRRYRLAHRTGHLKGLGKVKVVFSRRRGDNSRIALVTNDLRAAKAKIVADDLKRWAIELLIKDEKQHLGMGDYRVLRYQAVVRHLHLVDIACACLTRLALDEQDAQGRSTRKRQMPLRLPPINQLKIRMRQVVWRDAVEDVIKKSHERPVIRRLERLIAA